MEGYWLKLQGTCFPLRRGETLIGRSPYCSIVLSNGHASRQHCALRHLDDGLFISDLGSSNGTLVNGEELAEDRQLFPGDLIQIGTQLLEVLGSSLTDTGGGEDTQVLQPAQRSATTAIYAVENGQRATVELIEALVHSAASTSNPTSAVPAIRRALDSVVDDQRLGNALPSGARVRLRAIAERVAGWVDGGALDDWKNDMVRKLELAE